MTTKHEIKTCPRCGAAFECRANRASRCACSSVVIPEAVLDRLQADYSDCLCVDCLRTLVAKATEGASRPLKG